MPRRDETIPTLAVWLSFAPHSALHLAERIVREISEGGATLGRFAPWLNPHVTTRFAVHAAVVAWVDGVSTAVEGLLLFQGSAWECSAHADLSSPILSSL